MAVIAQDVGDRHAVYHADCMRLMPDVRPESVGLSVYSPPYPELYQYSNDPRDMSNCTTYEEGVEQYRYVVRELYRLTMPGRVTCVHCMDLKKGSYFQRDFPGDVVRVHEEAGWHFFCRVTVWKDPWLIARRTRMKSLQHKYIVKDSSMCRVAGPDYVLMFKKGGKNPRPIEHPRGLKRYAGETPIPEHLLEQYANYSGDQRKNRLSHWIWRRYASPVWADVRLGRTVPYEDSKETDEEHHVCPLSQDVTERCLTLWSNPDDVVLTPFMGVGNEVCCALAEGRRAVGVELKESYYRQAVANVRAALTGTVQADLFAGEAR